MTESGSKAMKRFLALSFIIVLFLGFMKSGSYTMLDSISNYFKQADYKKEGAITVSGMENEFNSSLWNKKELINLNGSMAKLLHIQGYYGNMGMYVTDDGYIVSAYDQTTTDYEYGQTVAFRDFLESNGIRLLYVNEPAKYIDDSEFTSEFGVDTFTNRNMDRFLNRIREAGINTVDLRDNIREEQINVKDLFYRTDHHWTAPAGLWASRIMAGALNDYCGYDIDLTILDPDQFETREWKDCWLGEQGRKLAVTYTGLDDYTEVKPTFETDYTFISGDGTAHNGNFNEFINEWTYNTEIDVYDSPSWHYSYNRLIGTNNDVEKGKILLVGDSYDNVTQCFLSLCVNEIDSLVLRGFDDSFSLRDYIINNGYDTVIIAYAQFMLGSHDDPSSANYRMYSFEY